MALFMYIFLLAIPLFLFIFLKHRKSINGNFNRLPPGPPTLPLIGHLHLQMLDDSVLPHVFLWKLSQKYGSLMFLRLGFKPTLVVSSAKMTEEVMRTHDLDSCSRPNQRCARKLSYDGLDLSFSPYSDYWREMRKICVVHLFSRVQKYRHIREDEAARLVERIRRSSVDSKLVNLSKEMTCFSSSIICRVGFGKRYGDEGFERSRLHGFLKEVEVMFSSFSFSDYFPFMGWVDRFTGFLDRLEKTFEELDGFYQEVIDEHLDPNKLKSQHEDIVDVLLRDVFLAGTGTAAATAIWVMTFLMKNPKCLKKTQTQIRNSIRKKGFVNEDDVRDLTYLKAVIKETFRLQPTVPLLVPRETLRQSTIDGYHVPAGTLVYVNSWAIGRDPESWENPDEFCPERFIRSSIDYKGSNFEFIPFGAGRRVCPGMRMGVLNLELALANLLYEFDWEMPIGMNVEDLDCDAVPGLVTHRKTSLILAAKKIDD